jgi:hypothetical protein
MCHHAYGVPPQTLNVSLPWETTCVQKKYFKKLTRRENPSTTEVLSISKDSGIGNIIAILEIIRNGSCIRSQTMCLEQHVVLILEQHVV